MDSDGCLLPFVLMVGFALGTILVYMMFVADVPSAMDVYQGKTIMQYTCKDGVAIDSIVVFKEE